MSNIFPKIDRELAEQVWPNHRAVILQHFAKMTPLVYIANDNSRLELLLERLPSEWRHAKVIEFRKWFDSSDEYKAALYDTTEESRPLVLTHQVELLTDIQKLPPMLLFLPKSVIADNGEEFIELRDVTGYAWGDREKGITSTEVLNPA